MAGVPIQFCTSEDTALWPPQSSTTRSVFNCLRAAYTAAEAPAGPPPTIIRSYIVKKEYHRICSFLFGSLFAALFPSQKRRKTSPAVVLFSNLNAHGLFSFRF